MHRRIVMREGGCNLLGITLLRCLKRLSVQCRTRLVPTSVCTVVGASTFFQRKCGGPLRSPFFSSFSFLSFGLLRTTGPASIDAKLRARNRASKERINEVLKVDGSYRRRSVCCACELGSSRRAGQARSQVRPPSLPTRRRRYVRWAFERDARRAQSAQPPRDARGLRANCHSRPRLPQLLHFLRPAHCLRVPMAKRCSDRPGRAPWS